MSAAATISPRLALVKRATREAIEACGGLDVVGQATRAGKSQLSRCSSQNDGDTLSLRDALAVDELSLGRGGPFIVKAMARALNHALVDLPEGEVAAGDLATAVVTLSAELGDLSRCIADALKDRKVTPKEAVRALDELHHINQVTAQLRLMLIALRDGEVRA